MNKTIVHYLSLFLFLIALGSACTKAQQTSGANAVDLAKLEEIKKALAEKAAEINTTPASEIKDPTAEDLAAKKKIVSIRTTPLSLTMIEGTSEDFSILGAQADGQIISLKTDLIFSLDRSDRLTVPTGPESSRFNIKALAPGRSVLTIKYGTVSTTLEVQVNAKQVLAIDVFPKSMALGSPTRFRLNVVYDNGTQSEVSAGVQWESTTNSYLQSDAQSSSTGVFTGIKVGYAGIRATYAGQSIVSRTEVKMPKIESIAVQSESDTFLLGTQVQIKAIATFASGNTFDISSSVSWQSLDPAIATITASGELEAIFPGDTYIKAAYGTVSGQSLFYVTSVNFADIRLEVINTTVPAGLSVNYKLWGIKVDHTEVEITTYGRWISSDTSIARSGTNDTPKVPGKFTGLVPGTITVTSRYGTFIKTATLTVTEAAVVSMVMTSNNAEGACGINEPKFTVNATLSDGNSKDITGDVTFSVTPLTAGAPHTDPTKKGVIVTTQAGNAVVQSLFNEIKTNQLITASFPIVVGPGTELGVGIIAPLTSVPYGSNLELKAGQIMSCGTGLDFTNASSWLTDNSGTITTTINTNGSKGFLVSSGVDTAPTTTPILVKVSAIKGTLRSDLNIEVRPKEVSTIAVAPNLTEIDVGSSTPLTMTSRFTDGSSVDMTDITPHTGYSLQYSINDCVATGCATINPVTGVVTAGTQEGTVRVYASLSTPQGFSVISTKVNVSIQSKCASGTRVGLYCLYKSVKGQSCTQACGAGSYHTATQTVFGKGGLATDCDLAIKAFNHSPGLETANVNKSKGLGCSIIDLTALSILKGVRENTTATNATDFETDYMRLCACHEP